MLYSLPQAGSTAINKAVTSATVLAVIELWRQEKPPVGLRMRPHDSGAFESFALGVQVEVTNFAIE